MPYMLSSRISPAALSVRAGVGDSASSWGFCPGRLLKFNSADGKGVKIKVAGVKPARAGDCVGTSIDLAKGEVRFYLNGKDLGAAYTGLNFKDRSVYPALTICRYQICSLNFGTSVFGQNLPHPLVYEQFSHPLTFCIHDFPFPLIEFFFWFGALFSFCFPCFSQLIFTFIACVSFIGETIFQKPPREAVRSVISETPPLPYYLHLDGAHVKAKLLLALGLRKTISIEALVRPSVVEQQEQVLISMGDPAASGFSFSIVQGGRLCFEA